MSSMGEYGSLLQLGFGTGAGLSVFQAPLELKFTRLNKSIDQQMEMTEGSSTEKGKIMYSELSALKLKLLGKYQFLSRFQRPFLAFSLLGAAANWYALVYVSRYASEPVSDAQGEMIVIGSVWYYVFIGAILVLIAQWNLWGIERDLKRIEEAP